MSSIRRRSFKARAAVLGSSEFIKFDYYRHTYNQNWDYKLQRGDAN